MNNCTHTHSHSHSHIVEKYTHISTEVSKVLSVWYRNYTTRAALKNVSVHMLNDIGISADDVVVEANKGFWE